MISKSNNTQVPTAAINILQNTHTTTNMASNGGANNLTNNSKMGSRRIFTPHFKLQVLESYRKDSDCKGNQRATARKYNIHRRQIQKWLQCESNLRSSVASINHSGLKHQFHNVSQQQHQQVPIMIPTNSNSQFGYHHFESKPQQLPLDTARHSVATNSTTVPSIPVVVPSTNASTQGVYAAANLAAVVAAAAAAGAIAIASTSTTNTSSPLCQTVVSGNTAGISSPILHTHHLQPHHHHHHHYDTPYTHASSNMSIPIPVLTHISPQHHRHYPYNLPPHTHTLLQPQSRVSTIPSLMSSTCLPVTVLSSTDLASSGSPQTNITAEEVLFERSEAINLIDLSEQETKIVVDNIEDCCGRKSLNKYPQTACIENGNQKEYALQNYNLTQESSNTPCLTVTPIDLSIGSRRENAENINCSLRHLPSTDDVAENKNENVVDLTFRKRKVISMNDQPNKHMRNSENNSSTLLTKVKEPNESGDDDDDIEVEMEIKSPPPKPVKLFKPYLLDEKDEKFDENEEISEKKVSDENESCISSLYKIESDGKPNNFNLSNIPDHNFQVESTYFQRCKSLNLPSAFHKTAMSATSPVIPCAEGSPVSGYESSSSTYSESSYRDEYYRINEERTCNIDLQVHAVCENLTCQENCVRKWLNQDTNSNPPATNASIVLYA